MGRPREVPSRPSLQNRLAAQLQGVWSGVGCQLLAPLAAASEVRSHPAQVTPFLGQLHLVTGYNEGKRPGYSAQPGTLGPGWRFDRLRITVLLFLVPNSFLAPSFTGVHPNKHPVSLTVSLSASREPTYNKCPRPSPSFSEFISLYCVRGNYSSPNSSPMWSQVRVSQEGGLWKI